MVPRLLRLVARVLIESANETRNRDASESKTVVVDPSRVVVNLKETLDPSHVATYEETMTPVQVQEKPEQVSALTTVPETLDTPDVDSVDGRWEKHLTDRERRLLYAKRDAFLQSLTMIERLNLTPEEHDRAIADLKKRLLDSLMTMKFKQPD